MGYDDDTARVDRASKKLNEARKCLVEALDEVYDSAWDTVPFWVVEDLNETLLAYGLRVRGK